MATGLTVAQAKSLMTKYLNSPIPVDSSGNYHGTLPGSPEIHSNCTLFSTWFLLNYTTNDVRLATLSGDGVSMAQNFVNANPGKVSIRNTPVAFSLFSISAYNSTYITEGTGHTGIVLGIDGNTVITGEANYGHPFGGLDAQYPNHGTVVCTYPLSTFNSSTGVTFVDLNKYIISDLKGVPAPVNPPKNSSPTTGVNYTPHLTEIGWTKWFSNGTSTGNTTKKVEAIAITVDNLPEKGTIQYRGHVQSLGWQGWVSNGAIAGTTGQSRRLEAIEIKLTEDLEKSYDISYRAYVEGKGWQAWVSNGTSNGNTTKKVEAIAITVDNLPEKGTIQYRGHVQSRGWQGWVTSGAVAGTTGQSKRLEAVEIKLTEDLEKSYDISYRTYVEGKGWQAWVSNGATSGTIDKALELKDIQIKLIEKPLVKPPVNTSPVKGVNYIPHISGIGWTKWVSNGASDGNTTKKVEAIAITVDNLLEKGTIQYRGHIQSRGWQGWVTSGTVAGTTGQSKRLEAIEIKLTEDLEKSYNISYRVYVENIGWQAWVSNGATSGTIDKALELKDVQIKLIKK